MKKERIIFIISLVMMLLATSISVYATSCLYNSSDVSYTAPTGSGLSANVQDSLTEVYGHCTDYTNLEQRVSTIENNFLDKTYPVGSIYISTTDSTVSAVQSRFGGTWQKYGEGRTLISANSTYPINTTGGSVSESYTPAGTNTGGAVQSHTLTSAESGLPAHDHSLPIGNAIAWGSGQYDGVNLGRGDVGFGSFSGTNNVTAKNATSGHTHGFTQPKFTGTAATISHMQPYITVYMYKRVS